MVNDSYEIGKVYINHVNGKLRTLMHKTPCSYYSKHSIQCKNCEGLMLIFLETNCNCCQMQHDGTPYFIRSACSDVRWE